MHFSPTCILFIRTRPNSGHSTPLPLTKEVTTSLRFQEVCSIDEGKNILAHETIDVVLLDASPLHVPEALHGLSSPPFSPPVILLVDHFDTEQSYAWLMKGAEDILVLVEDPALFSQALLRSIERSSRNTFLADALEDLPDAILVLTGNGTIVFANQAATRLFMTERSTLQGKILGLPLSAPGRATLDLPGPDGTVTYAEMQSSPTRWSGQPATIVSLRDVSVLKQREDDLHRSYQEAEKRGRQKADMLANISHELRVPLASIIGFADALVNDLPEGQLQTFAELIQKGGNRLLETINSILDLAQLDALAVSVNKQRTNLFDVAQEVTGLLLPLAKRKGLRLVVEKKTDNDRVILDPILLQRIFNNLIGNALKYTREGEVHVEISREGDHVKARIIDTGIGIDPAFIPYLFDEYSQAEKSFKAQRNSSGLGLAITRRLVELQGGKIEVSSVRGRGSIFTVLFPSSEEVSGEKATAREGPHKPHTHRRPVVLLLEDRPEIQLLIQHIVAPSYDIHIAKDADTVLYITQYETFDLLLFDVTLKSGETSADVLKFLRGKPNFKDTPAIAMTHYGAYGSTFASLRDMGFNATLMQPFTQMQLLNLLEKSLVKEAVPGAESC